MNYVDASTVPVINNGQIKLHGPEGFAGMRKAGQLAAQALDVLADYVKPGVTTQKLDDVVFEFAMDNNCVPATLSYRGYTKSVCTSINHVVCHGIPNEKPLREGDIVNLDITLIVDGWHGDTSRMYPVGHINRKAERLCQITYDCLMKSIDIVKPGATLGDIGHVIQQYAESERCTVVRDFCGHGLGQLFHDVPNILHYGEAGQGTVLKAGMIFTIEPMINLGKPTVKILSDGWTAVTRDKSLTAQFEHSIGVTKDGCEIFTLSPAGLHQPGFSNT